MTVTDYENTPFKVHINGSGFGHSADFATMREAYAEANRIQQAAQADEDVLFTDWRGSTGRYAVLSVQVLRWNPNVEDYLSHARRWSKANTPSDALTPLPQDWHGQPLPPNWYLDAAEDAIAA